MILVPFKSFILFLLCDFDLLPYSESSFFSFAVVSDPVPAPVVSAAFFDPLARCGVSWRMHPLGRICSDGYEVFKVHERWEKAPSLTYSNLWQVKRQNFFPEKLSGKIRAIEKKPPLNAVLGVFLQPFFDIFLQEK